MLISQLGPAWVKVSTSSTIRTPTWILLHLRLHKPSFFHCVNVAKPLPALIAQVGTGLKCLFGGVRYGSLQSKRKEKTKEALVNQKSQNCRCKSKRSFVQIYQKGIREKYLQNIDKANETTPGHNPTKYFHLKDVGYYLWVWNIFPRIWGGF